MVPPELQLGDGHLLPQHRPRPSDPDFRPEPGDRSWPISTTSWRGCWRNSTRRQPRRASRLRRRVEPDLSRDARRPGGDDPVVPRFADQPEAARLGDRFTRCLYATYLSYLAARTISPIRSTSSATTGANWPSSSSRRTVGQIFVSRTKPGITRGNHFHHTKVEKFLVVEGEAVIRFRHIDSDEVLDVPRSRQGFPRRRHSARLYPLDRERGHGRDGRAVLGQRDFRSRDRPDTIRRGGAA